jgi:serine protease AprX
MNTTCGTRKSKGGDGHPRMRRAGGLGVALIALFVFSGLCASSSWTKNKPGPQAQPTFLASKLATQAKQHPNDLVRVIIQSNRGVSGATTAFKTATAGKLATPGMATGGTLMTRKLNIVGAVSVLIRANQLARLAQNPGLTITPDEAVKATGTFKSDQLWPAQSGNAKLWPTVDEWMQSSIPAIAIVDSGVQCNRADFTGRVLKQVNLTTAVPNSACDGRGHGTFVAGIAAGAAAGYAGAAPAAPIVSLDVMNDQGMAWTSDVIAAADWILQHKSQYNIRVANFSLHTATANSFTVDPLDKAVEKLWASGVTVVASAGNYGDGTATGVKYAPGNDPFVITVGAVDLEGTATTTDDEVAPFSTFGYTQDGFAKPEIVAAGRYMVGPVPEASTMPTEQPDHVTTAGYMKLSGTSFAAPVIAGAAAHILALYPHYTPDQVKGALMLTARPMKKSVFLAAGVGQLNAVKAASLGNPPPNPNLALDRFLVADPNGGPAVFDAASWVTAIQSDASWNDASWNDASWNDASWADASWADASWNDASWNDASWNDASWNDASWADASWADAALEVEAAGDGGIAAPDYTLTPDEQAAIDADPDLQPETPLPLP